MSAVIKNKPKTKHKTSSISDVEHLPYRDCVGLMVLNKYGDVFVARRIDTVVEAWQMPQGGIDEGEDAKTAALRELEEEIGTNKVEVISTCDDWFYYDLPEHLVSKLWGGKYRGQRQKWFLLQFTGDDGDINIETQHPEFSEWRWDDPQNLPSVVIPFKRDIYVMLLDVFSREIAAIRHAAISGLQHDLKQKKDELNAACQRITHLEEQVGFLQGYSRGLLASTSWRITAPMRFTVKLIKLLLDPESYSKGILMLRKAGVSGLIAHLRNSPQHHALQQHDCSDMDHYQKWVAQYDTLDNIDHRAISRKIKRMEHKPLFSIVMPVYNVDEIWLRQALDSVLDQGYTNWQLCIADDASTAPHITKVLNEYTKKDKRIEVCFREENGHISEASNSALTLAKGEFIALMDHDDVLPAHALYVVADYINKYPDAKMLYSDEDKLSEDGERFAPYFKSDWNPDLFLGQNMFSHLGIFARDLVEQVGGFRKGYEGSQDYDLALRCMKLVEEGQIRHIPHILYHWRAISGSTSLAVDEKNYTVSAARHSLEDYLADTGAVVEPAPVGGYHHVIWPIPKEAPKISIIIPTRNALGLTRQAIESIIEKTDYPNYEIILVDNQSDDPDALAYFAQAEKDYEQLRVLQYDAPFNYSAINNYAVGESDGELICLLNNDIEVIDGGWLTEMAGHALRDDIGAVGAKLLYPDNTIQHAGVLMGAGSRVEPVGGHLFLHRWKEDHGYFGRAILVQNLSVVTAACLVVRRDVFTKVDGLNETDLTVAFNDVDFCLKIRKLGLRNVFTPYAMLYHHESASRGKENTPEKRKRFEKEVQYMRSQWREVIDNDPYYNPNLDPVSADYSLAFPPRIQYPWKQ